MRILVASTNPNKFEGTRRAFAEFPKVFISTSITTGVNKDLPMLISEESERLGALVISKHVVFAGHNQELREKYMQEASQHYFGVDVPEFNSPEFELFVYRINTTLIDEATHIFVILDKTSFGVAMELEHALTRPARGLPEAKILGLIHKDALPKLSKMVTGAARKYKNFVIRTYVDMDDIKKLVKEFLG